MKLLVDCAPLSNGGGVQVAIALLVNLKATPDINWQAVVPEPLRTALGPQLTADPRLIFVQKRSALDFVRLNGRLHAIEAAFRPDLVFTVFGPAYFRASAPQLTGFALPHLIYDADCPQTRRDASEPLVNQLRAALLRRSDWWVVETETVRQRLAARVGIDLAKITVIGNSVNPILTQSPPVAAPRGGRFGLFVPSAHYKHKNLEVLPRVAAAMQSLDPALDFEFRLTLDAASAPWLQIKAEAQRLGVAARLQTLGVVPMSELARHYAQAGAVFLPTVREASTAVYPESFYCQRPLVTSDLDFARELCGDAALYVPPHDPTGIATRLVELARQPQLAARLIDAGTRQLARVYPEPDHKFQHQLQLFFQIAARPSSGVDKAPYNSTITTHSDPNMTRRDSAGNERPTGGEAVQFHDDIASEWDEKYLCGGFARRARWFSDRVLPSLKGEGRWLDVGCGTGYFTRLMSAQGLSVIGVDASPAMVERAELIALASPGTNRIDFQRVETAERLPFADNSMAGCVCLSVIEYLDRPEACFDELARVTKPGGLLVISVPNRYSPLRAVQRLAALMLGKATSLPLKYRALSKFDMSREELRAALEQRGFDQIQILGFDRVLPTPVLSIVPPGLMYAIAVKGAVTPREGSVSPQVAASPS